MSFFAWPFQHENADLVVGWSFWISAAGLIGLILTFYQLVRTRSLAQAAKDESQKLQAAMKIYDAAQEASRAKYALATARRHLKNKSWLDASESYEDFRSSMISIRNNSRLSPELSRQIEEASTYILKLCLKIDQDNSSGSVSVDYAKTSDMMRQHADLILFISSSVEDGVF